MLLDSGYSLLLSGYCYLTVFTQYNLTVVTHCYLKMVTVLLDNGYSMLLEWLLCNFTVIILLLDSGQLLDSDYCYLRVVTLSLDSGYSMLLNSD